MQTFNVDLYECWLCPTGGMDQEPNTIYKPVIQILEDGTEIPHPSIQEAAAAVGVSEGSIRKAAGAQYARTFAANCKWRYA